MKICILGSSGLVGQSLVERLRQGGHDVVRAIRAPEKTEGDAIVWDPSTGKMQKGSFENFDAFINLAGENIASGRWTAQKKKRIYDSRVIGTAHLAHVFATLQHPPRVLINASAIGFYGNKGSEEQNEKSPPADDFLASVCKDWESATAAAEAAGVRVVKLRIGAVLSKNGGVLGKTLLPFKLGLGGVIGSGQQYFSWIALDDLLNVICFALENNELSGPVNAVAPNPVTNAVFTKALGAALHRPTVLPMPAFAARLAFGEMADAIMLGGAKVVPRKLLDNGFRFQYPELAGALAHCLKT